MTNREVWTPNMSDKLIEMAICDDFIKRGCEGCPITTICEPYTEGRCSDDAYMAAVTEWLDEEAEATISEEDALKLIDSLMSVNGTLRREIIMSDAIASIGKEDKNDQEREITGELNR